MTALDDLLAMTERAAPKKRYGKAVKGGPSERVIQRGIVKALRNLGIFVFHIPNEGDLPGGYKQWAVMKADGCVEGVPDLGLLDRDGEFGMLEIKRPGGSLTASQEELIPKLRARTPRVAVVTSLDEALAVLARWGWING
jgi:hypothetical protein